MERKPINNRAGPKKINLANALKDQKKKEKRNWRPVMIDIKEEEEDPNTRIIAPVTKQQWQQQQKQWQQRQQRQPQQEQQQQRVIQMPERFNRVPQNQTEPKPCTLMCGMKMHVTDATKFLASVRKITQNGNRVIFDEDRRFIQHK